MVDGTIKMLRRQTVGTAVDRIGKYSGGVSGNRLQSDREISTRISKTGT